MAKTATSQIEESIFRTLQKHPHGLRWSKLLEEIKKQNPSLHPKTINGILWKITKKYPEKINKPAKGVYRLA